jgi:hypothetical protein
MHPRALQLRSTLEKTIVPQISTMSHPPGLVATVYPMSFNSAALGNLINCFTFLTGFDDTFMEFLGVKSLRPEDMGWTKLQTKEDWISAVSDYFKPQPGSTVDRCGTCFTQRPHTP